MAKAEKIAGKMASSAKKKGKAVDPRFDTSADPRFRQMPKKERKVKVDSRFKAMFSKEFAEPSRVNSVGKKVDNLADMKKFYELEDEEKSDVGEQKEMKVNDKSTTFGSDDEGAFHWNEESSESESDEEENIVVGEDTGGAQDVWSEDECEKNENISRRIAVQNCDWDNISAEDIFMLFHGFLENEKVRNRKVEKVTIYPSDYGLKKIEHEKIHGPQIDGLSESAVDGEEQGEDLNAIRQYQRQRLKYYYAVVECDSAETAEFLYDELEGFNVEYIFPISVDIRFIPDDIEFPNEPKSYCNEVPSGYVLPDISGQQAMRHSKVKCSWDEGDARRTKMLTKSFSEKEMMNMDLQAYLASSDEEEENGNVTNITEDNLESYRGKLLSNDLSGSDLDSDLDTGNTNSKKISNSDGEDSDISEEKDNFDMEFKFNPQLEQLADDIKSRALSAAKKGELKKSKLDKKVLTPWEQYLEKKKKNKDQRRAERKELLAKQESDERFGKLKDHNDDDDDDDNILSSSKKKKSVNKKWDLSVDYSTANKSGTKGNRNRNKSDGDKNDGVSADLELLMGSEADKKHFDLNVKSLKKKKKAGLETSKKSIEIDVKDSRLAKMFEDPDFAIDATNPNYKQTEGMAKIIREKSKRRKEQESARSQKLLESKKRKKDGAVDMDIFGGGKKKKNKSKKQKTI
eukprot:gene32-504_t